MEKEVAAVLSIVLLVSSVAGVFLIKETQGQAISLLNSSSVQTKIPTHQPPVQVAPTLTPQPFVNQTTLKTKCPSGTVIPTSNMIITQSTTFCPGTYNVVDIFVTGNNIVLDCNGANLIGNFNVRFQPTYSATGSKSFRVSNSRYIEIKNCNMRNYETGIFVDMQSQNILIHNNKIRNSASGIALVYANNSKIFKNEIRDMIFNGIFIQDSGRNQIYENNIYNITANWMNPGETPIYVCPGTGILVIGAQSELNKINQNNLKEICYEGIGIYDARLNEVTNNNLTTIFYKGIRTYNAWESFIEKNTVENTPFTIILDSTNQARVKQNNLYLLNSNDPQDNQGNLNIWINNFYSDIQQIISSCPDANSDNICDVPRAIFGSTFSVDNSPSKIPN